MENAKNKKNKCIENNINSLNQQGINQNSEISSKMYNNMMAEINSICTILLTPSNLFKSQKCKELCIKINEYIIKYQRLLYSQISDFIYNLSDSNSNTFISNLDCLRDFVLNDSDEPSLLVARKIVLKIYDHSNLAFKQLISLKQNDSEFKRMFLENITPLKAELGNEFNEHSKSTTAQLISLLGIFTAMAFLVFGGLSSLQSVFSNISEVGVIKLILLSCLWGFLLINVIALFVSFICKVSDKDFEIKNKSNEKLICRYPSIIISNVILFVIFIFTGSIYCLNRYRALDWAKKLMSKNPENTCVVFGLIIVAILIGIFHICNTTIKKND